MNMNIYFYKKEYSQLGPFSLYGSNDYSGSGYILDLDPYMKRKDFTKKLEELRDQNWLNSQTMLLVFAINFYDIGRD